MPASFFVCAYTPYVCLMFEVQHQLRCSVHHVSPLVMLCITSVPNKETTCTGGEEEDFCIFTVINVEFKAISFISGCERQSRATKIILLLKVKVKPVLNRQLVYCFYCKSKWNDVMRLLKLSLLLSLMEYKCTDQMVEITWFRKLN